MAMDNDLYRAFSIPWLSDDPVNLVEFSGVGFASVFDNESVLDATDPISLADSEFFCFWRPAFPGWNGIALLVFRKRAE